MKRKVSFILTFCILFFGTLTAFGWVRIPGFNCPYDEAAFYSSDTPDYADSPSIFGQRYLMEHAMEVYDPKRHSEQIKTNSSLSSILDMVKQITGLKELNILSFGSDSLAKNKNDIENINKNTQKLNSAQVISDIQGKKIFRDGNISNYQPDTLKKEQLEALVAAYAAIAEDAQKNLEDLEIRTAALNEAIENSANAQGYMQAVQARNEINALKEAEEIRYNALLNDYMNLLYLEGLKEEDEDNRRTANKPRYRVADPYNLTETDKLQYPNAVREKTHFVDFE